MEKEKILLSEIKNHLGITWDDKGTDRKVSEMISQGEFKIMKLINSTRDDFYTESDARNMLFEFCRLSWAGVPEKFDELYRSDIVGARLSNILGVWE